MGAKKHVGAGSLFFRFAAAQIFNGCAAESMDLPTSLGERTKWRASVYCSHKYFDFVCFVESTYLANLTLKMIRHTMMVTSSPKSMLVSSRTMIRGIVILLVR
jgi:hypothetical protein